MRQHSVQGGPGSPRAAGARKTLTCRAHGAPSRHVWKTVHPTATITPPAGAGRTTARSPQDQERLPRPTPCSTVYFLQYSTTAPRDSGENDDFHDPLLMYTVPPCDNKRRRRAPLKGDVGRDHPDTSTTLSTRYWHSPLSASPLAETWELPSHSSLACTPLLQAPPVQDNTVPSHTPLLDVRPRGRNQDKSVRYCVASCINIWDEETRSIY